MASQVQICNISLGKIGDYYISSMIEGTKQQIYCSIFWDNARDTLLQSYQWNFATERVRLARLADVPVWQYTYKYQLPNDYLKIWDISVDGDFDSTSSIDYKREGNTILTNEETVYIKYTKKITDTTYFTPLFVRALACDLAILLAEPLFCASEATMNRLLSEKEEAVGQARGVEFDEGKYDPVGYYEMTYVRDN